MSGSLTIFKGRPQCVLNGVLAKDGSELVEQPPVTLASAAPEGADAEEEPEIAEMGVGGSTESPARPTSTA